MKVILVSLALLMFVSCECNSTKKQKLRVAYLEKQLAAKKTRVKLKKAEAPKDLLQLRCELDKKETSSERNVKLMLNVADFKTGEVCVLKKVSLKYE